MDNSTEGVTLYAIFINDVLKNYEADKDQYQELFELTQGYDLSEPFNTIPIQLYNDMCEWIQTELGKFNLIRVGRNIGETVYDTMQTNNMISADSTPVTIIETLAAVASQMIQDPKGRGWEILEKANESILLKRTQTFNSLLQFGLLDGLVRKAGVTNVKVEYKKEVAKGDDFDEYLVSWEN